MNAYKTIEQASRGATYQNGENTFTVYQISTYPRSSVLAGQQRRRWLDTYESEKAAREAHPTATLVIGTTYREPSLNHL
jgi:hypothetical protein